MYCITFDQYNNTQGCESSDFNLISDFFALHKTPFSDFNALKSTIIRHFRLFQTFSHRCSHVPEHLISLLYPQFCGEWLLWPTGGDILPSCGTEAEEAEGGAAQVLGQWPAEGHEGAVGRRNDRAEVRWPVWIQSLSPINTIICQSLSPINTIICQSISPIHTIICQSPSPIHTIICQSLHPIDTIICQSLSPIHT